MLGLFVLVCKVRDVWEWLYCMHVDTSEGGAVMSRCGFRSVCYLEEGCPVLPSNVTE